MLIISLEGMVAHKIRSSHQLYIVLQLKNNNLGLVVQKPVFGVSDKTGFKPVSSATEN